MKLYHWTFRCNLSSILARGLLTAKATGRQPSVWLCDSYRYHDVRYHIAERHDMTEESLVLLSVQMDEDDIRQSRWKGVYFVWEDIPPESISVVLHDSPAFDAHMRRVVPPPENLIALPYPDEDSPSPKRNTRRGTRNTPG